MNDKFKTYFPLWMLVLVWMYEKMYNRREVMYGILLSKDLHTTASYMYNILNLLESRSFIEKSYIDKKRIGYELTIDGKLLCEHIIKIINVLETDIYKILEEKFENENSNKKRKK